MNGEKHTPGEWFWSGNTLMASRGDHSEFVCDVDGASVADKALIAAAPDMLAALKLAEEWLSGWASADHQLAVIRAALLKSGSRP